MFAGAGDGAPSGDDEAVVAHADPAAPGVGSVGVQGEVETAFGADSGLGGAVPADQGFVVPQAEFASPLVAALGDGDGPFGVEPQPAWLWQDRPWLYGWLSWRPRKGLYGVVEPRGLEPLTPALQRRCSAS